MKKYVSFNIFQMYCSVLINDTPKFKLEIFLVQIKSTLYKFNEYLWLQVAKFQESKLFLNFQNLFKTISLLLQKNLLQNLHS